MRRAGGCGILAGSLLLAASCAFTRANPLTALDSEIRKELREERYEACLEDHWLHRWRCDHLRPQ